MNGREPSKLSILKIFENIKNFYSILRCLS